VGSKNRKNRGKNREKGTKGRGRKNRKNRGKNREETESKGPTV